MGPCSACRDSPRCRSDAAITTSTATSAAGLTPPTRGVAALCVALVGVGGSTATNYELVTTEGAQHEAVFYRKISISSTNKTLSVLSLSLSLSLSLFLAPLLEGGGRRK